jgi:hypothetical protein
MYELCMYVIRGRLCFRLETKYILCFLSNSDEWANVSLSVTTVTPSSDGRMTSARAVVTSGHSRDG